MKKKIETVMLVLFAIATIVGLIYVFNYMSKFGYNKIGEEALNIARLTSASIEITDEDLEELLNIEFNELSHNSVNKQIETIFTQANLSDNIEYVYVLRKLTEDEVKYKVETDEMAEFYGEEIGTPLNYIWLLDYIVNDDVRKKAQSDANYYDDIYRYTTVDEETREIYQNKESKYFINEDEWGRTITGFAPVYTVEGTYIGLIGVDVFASDFLNYRNKVFTLSVCMLILLVILLSIILSFRYVSDREAAQIDQLTGLYRRRYYEPYANKIVHNIKSEEDSLTIIMLDIDEFKRYNDFYGHMRGDIVISTVCKIIKESAEAYGAKVGRFGGEEFLVIAPNLSIEDGDVLAEKIRKDIEQLNITHENAKTNKFVTISSGLFTYVGGGKKMTFEQIVEVADTGLYSAKQSGRNRYVRKDI